MSFLRRRGRRGKVATAATTVAALAAFQALAIVGAGTAAAAGTCSYDLATKRVNIVITSGTASVVAVSDGTVAGTVAGDILFDGAACGGSPNISTALSVNVSTAVSVSTEGFTIDNTFGTPDREFPDTIAWFVDLGQGLLPGVLDNLTIVGSNDVDDEVVFTDNSFTMNGAAGTTAGLEWVILNGNDGDDTLDGSALVNTIMWASGGNGDDFIAGGAQRKLPVAPAPELLTGDAGTDTLSYATRTTQVFVDSTAGIAGYDANGDCDAADPGDEQDAIATFEIFETGSGNDCFVSNAGVQEAFVPGDGDDDVTGDANDTISWESSSALMTIDPANGEATGQGADTFSGPTNFIGSAFDDVLIWDAASTSTFVGGDGVDTVDASAKASAQTINLDTLDDGVGPLGPFSADSLEDAIGGSGDDNIDGNDLRNVLTGNDGNDDLNGAGGNDTLFGGLGNDNFVGGDGADTVDFGASANKMDVDVLLGIATGEGDDSLASIEIVKGSAFNDTIVGGGGLIATNFRITGRAGNDILTGSGSNDTLKGGKGNDKLRGLEGGDTLVGGKGKKDKAWGGPGTDVCKGAETQRSCEI